MHHSQYYITGTTALMMHGYSWHFLEYAPLHLCKLTINNIDANYSTRKTIIFPEKKMTLYKFSTAKKPLLVKIKKQLLTDKRVSFIFKHISQISHFRIASIEQAVFDLVFNALKIRGFSTFVLTEYMFTEQEEKRIIHYVSKNCIHYGIKKELVLNWIKQNTTGHYYD